MRIALFADTYRPTVNGVARALGLLVDHAVAAGHEVALVTPRLGESAAGTSVHRQLPGPRFPLYPELRDPGNSAIGISWTAVTPSSARWSRYGITPSKVPAVEKVPTCSS